MQYPASIHLSALYPQPGGAQTIHYFDVSKKMFTQHKCGPDHEADQRRYDAALLRQMIRDYYQDTAHMQYTTMPHKVEEARQLLADCANALSERGSSRKEFAGKHHNSPDLLHLVAGLVPIALQVVGYDYIIDTSAAVSLLCRQLTAICKKAESRYEEVQYADTHGVTVPEM